MLKLNDGTILAKQLIKVVQVMLVLHKGKGSTNYTRACLTQLLILVYQSKKKLPFWTMLKSNSACFNEETGELAFSVLSRCVLGDSSKSNFDHLNDMYALLHTYMALTDDIRDDFAKHGPTKNWRKVYKPDCEELEETVAFMRLTIRSIKHGKYKIYDGSDQSYERKDHAQRHLVNRKRKEPVFVEATLKTKFEHVIDRLVDLIGGSTWGVTHLSDTWPEFNILRDEYLDEGRVDYRDQDEGPQEQDDEYEPEEEIFPNDKKRPRSDDVAHSSPERDVDDSDVDEPVNSKSPKRAARKSRSDKIDGKEWGMVNDWNIVDDSRSNRRGRARRNISEEGMISEFKGGSKYLE